MDLNNELHLRDAKWMASDAARPALRKAATRSPVFWYENEGDGFWVVLQHADIVEISRRAVEFSTSRGIMLADQPGSTKGVLLWTDPPEHRRLRRYVHDFFSPRASTRLAPWIRERCIELVGRARGRDKVDMIGEVAADLPLMTISKMMGVPEAEQPRFLHLANRIFDEAGNSPEAYQESMEDLAAFGLELAKAEHSAELFDAMRSVEDNGEPLCDEEFGAMFMQIAGAAVETTRTVIGSILERFAAEPHLIDAIRGNEGAARSAVEEFLRYYPPLLSMRRTATCDVEFRGMNIRSGDKVLMYYASGNFDESVFTEPFAFDIYRKPNPHLTFGTGEHICLGLVLARTELIQFVLEFCEQAAAIEMLEAPVVRLAPEGGAYKKLMARVTYRQVETV